MKSEGFEEMPKTPRCDNCKHSGFSMFIYIDSPKPVFVCNQCNNRWTYGYDGGEYAKFLKEKQRNKKSHEPDFIFNMQEK